MSKPLIYLVFRDIALENLHGYELLLVPPGGLILKELTLPAAFGFPALFVCHLQSGIANVFVISQTDYELDDAKRREIIDGAIAFIDGAKNDA